MWRHRGLLWELVKREFSGRYRGSFGGAFWSLAQPLFLLAAYTLAFGVILGLQWAGATGIAGYALAIFAGLIVFNLFAECLARAPSLVVSVPNYVKKVVFPIELLPWVLVLGALVHAFIALAVWMAAYLVLRGVPPASWIASPLLLCGAVPLLLGVSWLLAALGVMVRDTTQVASLVAQALLFVTPIFYPLDAVPASLRPLLLANPLTFVVESLRRALLDGAWPAWGSLAAYLVAACAFAWLCLAFFRRARPAFADLV